jgi:hypothetical protein
VEHRPQSTGGTDPQGRGFCRRSALSRGGGRPWATRSIGSGLGTRGAASR